MKVKFLFTILIGAALTVQANGYKDGIEYYKAGQFDNAREILERTLNDPSTDKAMAYYYLGQTALAQGDRAAAKSNFDKGLAANPECAYNYVGIGSIDLLNGNTDAAKDSFKQAQKLDKKNYEITVDIARAYYNADPVKFAKAVDEYLAKAHKDSKHKEPAIYILEGDMLFDAKDLGGAAGKYEQAITYEVDNPEGYVKYANAYIGVNPQYSIQKLEELLAKQPTSALAQRELAEKYYETDQWTKAANQYGSYIQNPNHFPEDKARYAVLLYANSEYQKSLDVAKQILASDPRNFMMQRIRMLDLAELKQYPEAQAAAESFLALTPNESKKEKFNPNDYTTYATVLESLGQDSLAIIQYEAAIAADPTKYDNLKTLSAAYTKAAQYQKAAEVFGQYLTANPDPSLTDYLQASGRWLNAANRAADDTARAANAQHGLDAINKVIAEASEVDPSFYQRQGRLNYAKAGNKSTKDVFDSYTKVVELLDADPANADPANPKNSLNLYKEAYLFMGNYYQEIGDSDNQNLMYQKSDEYAQKIQ